MKMVPVARAGGDLGLGDEIDGLDGVQDEDVEPAGMVGDDGTGAGHRPTLDHKRQAEDAQRAAADEAGDMRRDRAGLAAKRPFDQPDEEEKGQPAVGEQADQAAPPERPEPAQRGDLQSGRRNLLPGGHGPALRM